MLPCYVQEAENPLMISVVTQEDYPVWLSEENDFVRTWLLSTQFRFQAGNFVLIPDAEGVLSRAMVCVNDFSHFWAVGNLAFSLPEGIYQFDLDYHAYEAFAMSWGLGAYQFTRYKSSTRQCAQLVIPEACDFTGIANCVESIYLVRDLINTPTENMGPSELSQVAKIFCRDHDMQFKEIVGDDLLKKNYPAIHAVGRASDDEPRLLDLHWGNEKHPKLTLIGKGVCFDTGGLNIKNGSGMTLMKKDMGGAAHVLGLASMIIHAKLPVRLRVLMPVVENAISGSAYRPGDVISSRKGLTIEVGNTDAEGRVILADALAEAVSEKPDLMIDMATLTGAARIALGTELPALFSNHDGIAALILNHAELQQDPLWRMPLFGLYRDAISSSIADINNNTSDSYAGAITAALFLKEFVGEEVPWVHIDLMAWNLKGRPGRPQGGEAMGLRALFSFLSEKYV